MKRRNFVPQLLTTAGVALAAAFAPAQTPQVAPAKTSTAASATPPLLNQYCVGCHNQTLKTAGVSVQGLDATHAELNSDTWEKIIRKMKAGQMPPAGMPRPKAEVNEAFTKAVEQSLDSAATAHPNPGHPTIHRLNRAEYSNAVRDLLALDVQPGSKLPPDDTGYGFDNIGDVLSLSPVLIERYMSAAHLVSRLAVGDAGKKAEVNEFDMPRAGRGGRTERISDDLPFDSAGGLTVQYTFPVDADYIIRIKMGGADSKPLEEKLSIKAGTRTLAATFLADNTVPEVVPTFGPPAAAAAAAAAAGAGRGGGRTGAKLDIRLDGARVKLFNVAAPRFNSLAVVGPYDVQGPGESPSRQRVFVCKPTSATEETGCATKILSTLARRAYRRPVDNTDLKPLLAFFQAGRKEGDFDGGIEMAMRAMLVSPNFLFRIERDPANVAPNSVYRVNDYEMASRLSFFLWSSIPDDELLKLADQGKLRDPKVLSAQVNRMLDDKKSTAFVTNFAGQWLFLRNLAQVKPDQDAFPKFDASLRQGFQKETEMFFTAILREDRPVTDLLNANFTFVNQRLAEHYGIPDVYGSQFRRVTLSDPNRGGLLGQGSILTVTSYPNRTSVVQRGKWVLENLLGTPPPPPPPDIPALPEHSKDGKSLTMRQQMEQHRANPTCASCHSRMDPIGFSLENYDGIGSYRTTDGGAPIDASGKMPDGSTFSGPAGLKKLLLSNHKDEFLNTFTEKLMTFALGRGVESTDEPAIREVIRNASGRKLSIPDIISEIVKSPQFQMRRTRES